MRLNSDSKELSAIQFLRQQHISQFESKEGNDIYIPQLAMTSDGNMSAVEAKSLPQQTDVKSDEKEVKSQMPPPVPQTKSFDLTTAIEKHFLPSADYQVLLVTGDVGVGKSTFANRLAKHLWQQRVNNPHACLPIFIELLTVRDPVEGLLQGILDNEHVLQLEQSKIPIVLILDGYDELPKRKQENLFDKNLFFRKANPIKLIITCRQEALKHDRNYQELFRPAKGKLLEYQLLAFSPEQVTQYVGQHAVMDAKHNQHALEQALNDLPLAKATFNHDHKQMFNLVCAYWVWSKEFYLEQLQRLPELDALITTPYILFQALTVLPAITEGTAEESKKTKLQLTRYRVYEHFTQHHFKKRSR